MRSIDQLPLSLEYIHNTVINEPEELKWVKERIRATDWPIHIGPEEGRLLQLLIQLGNIKKIVETKLPKLPKLGRTACPQWWFNYRG